MNLIFYTMSSIFPYRFFFIPLALVEIHPPNVENSNESYKIVIVIIIII